MNAMSVISESEIVAKRDEWLLSQTETSKRIKEHTDALAHLNNQLMAVNGAIQACNIFLGLMNPTEESTQTK